MREVTILTGNPVVCLLAEMNLRREGVLQMADWVQDHRPDCVPQNGFRTILDLLPHNGIESLQSYVRNGDYVEPDGPPRDRHITDNELLVELAGRKCYDSFAEKAKKNSNAAYIKHTQSGSVKHASILYHAKLTFFIAGVSRRMSHELIRNYVGADRDEEGSPSQESTRFTHHYGWFVAPPHILQDETKIRRFQVKMQNDYNAYCDFIETEVAEYRAEHEKDPIGLDRKRIYEAASCYLPSSAETSFVWTTNPMALSKLFRERGDEAADAEFRRLINGVWKPLVLNHCPNLFPAEV